MIKNKEARGAHLIARVAIINGALFLAATQACVAQAPAAAPLPGSAASGVYTAAQADRGNTLYQNNCATCHGGSLQGEDENPPLSGKHFNAHWGGQPLSALFGFINTQMPLGQAGALGAQGNADVTAYILSVNEYPAGSAELVPDIKSLRAILIDKKQ